MSKFSDSTFYLAPSGYRETILFPQKPLSSIGHLSLGRASSATRTNPAGQVEDVCYNLLRYSEDFLNSLWVKIAASVTTDSIISPNGTLTSDKLIATAVNTGHLIYQTYSAQTQTYTFSTYAKKGEYDYMIMRLDNDISTVRVWFNLSNGTIGTSQGGFPTITNIGNGWYRCTMTYSSASAQSIYAVLYTANADNVQNFLGDGTSGIYVWGAQLVQGNLPKDYLYTSDRLNFPRVDYSDGSASLLLEPQRTNQMANSGWVGGTTPTGWVLFLTGSITTSVSTKNSSVNSLTFSGTAQRAFVIYSSFSFTSGVTYSMSVYVESVTTTATVDTVIGVANLPISSFSYLKNNVAISATTPIEAGNTYTIVFTPSATQFGDCRIGLGVGVLVTANYTLSMPQLEVGSYATSFILTPTSSTATRLADTFTRNNIYTNNLISSSGGTWFVDLKNNLSVTNTSTDRGIFISDVSTGIGNALSVRRLNAGRLQITKVVGGSTSLLYTTTTDTVKLAIRWNGTIADVFVNGVKQASAFAFTTTLMENLGTRSGEETYQFIQQMALWNTPLSDSQCIELTGVAYTTPAQAYGSLNLVSESPDCLYTSVNTINRI